MISVQVTFALCLLISTIYIYVDHYPPWTSAINLLGLCLLFFLCMIQIPNAIWMVATLNLGGSLGFAISLMFSTRLRENRKLLLSTRFFFLGGRGMARNLARFQFNHLVTMKYFFRFRPTFSNVFLFCMVHVYLTCTATVASSVSQLDQQKLENYLLLSIVANQFGVLVLAHVGCARHTHRIHGPFKRFLVLQVQCHGMAQRHRVKLAFFGQSFHTERRYGITYGPFGLVNMMTFVKVRSVEDSCVFKLITFSIFKPKPKSRASTSSSSCSSCS